MKIPLRYLVFFGTFDLNTQENPKGSLHGCIQENITYTSLEFCFSMKKIDRKDEQLYRSILPRGSIYFTHFLRSPAAFLTNTPRPQS